MNTAKKTSTGGELDPRNQLLVLVQRRGTSLKALSLGLGRNETYLQQFVKNGTPRELRFEDRVVLAKLLHCNVRDLGGHVPPRKILADAGHLDKLSLASLIVSGTIPVYGADTKKRGYINMSGKFRAGHAPLPPSLVGVKGAYACYMPDESMVPALRTGFLLYVNPNRTPTPHDDVIIRFAGGLALVRQLISSTPVKIVVTSHNPPKRQTLSRAEIEAVHVIVDSSRVRV